MSLPPRTTQSITGKTRLMFIMGDPIDHVVGTAVLNAAWSRLGRDMVTVPLHVRPDDLGRMLDMLRASDNVAGTGITIPHKIAGRAMMDHLTEAAMLAGAVNFVRRNADGTLTGHNVDGTGFLAGLAARGIVLDGRRVALSGAGGVARSIAFAVAGSGARSLTLRNRDMSKAEALARDIAAWTGANGCGVTARQDIGQPEILINATSLGMTETDPLPFTEAEMAQAICLAEVVMTPAETPVMKLAAGRGIATVGGRAMMDPQADLVARFLDGDPA
ncbi:shikimate dehydrogenase [Sulfitobacter sp. LCG007]